MAPERIYGFFLLHYIFSSCNAAVLTEAQFERSQSQRSERAPGLKATPDKWSPVDCGHYFYREDLFYEANRLFVPMERRGQEANIARIFVHAMRQVRDEVITDPRIVLSVMDYTEGPGVPFYAYAERFNEPATLDRLRSDIGPSPHWDYLDLERSRVPMV